ncbi:MAG TPA: leucyl/phenylalanyl-tRNA--protein transferase [Alphaproteobacteria bacterium]|jgi:leucyl/phenylalanyl-tRNA--protein transferase
MSELTPQMLLRAYALGVFPMAEGRRDPEIYWIDPEDRGILPLEDFHVPRRLRRTLRQRPFEIRCDTAFREVILGCAEPAPDRPDTWINDEILRLNTELFEMGYAHTVECWRDDTLVGGLYGIAIGGAFFGESMFSRVRDASKVALVHLVLRLRLGGFRLLDTQFVTRHLERFGAIEISRADYRQRLTRAIAAPARFYSDVPDSELEAFLQSITQRS